MNARHARAARAYMGAGRMDLGIDETTPYANTVTERDLEEPAHKRSVDWVAIRDVQASERVNVSMPRRTQMVANDGRWNDTVTR